MEGRTPPKLVVGLKPIRNQPRKYVTNPKFRKINLLQELTIPREQTIRDNQRTTSPDNGHSKASSVISTMWHGDLGWLPDGASFYNQGPLACPASGL